MHPAASDILVHALFANLPSFARFSILLCMCIRVSPLGCCEGGATLGDPCVHPRLTMRRVGLHSFTSITGAANLFAAAEGCICARAGRCAHGACMWGCVRAHAFLPFRHMHPTCAMHRQRVRIERYRRFFFPYTKRETKRTIYILFLSYSMDIYTDFVRISLKFVFLMMNHSCASLYTERQ